MKPGNIDINNFYVCIPCGNRYLEENGYLTANGICTCHNGICCVCGEETTVTDERAFRYLYKWKNNETTETTSDR